MGNATQRKCRIAGDRSATPAASHGAGESSILQRRRRNVSSLLDSIAVASPCDAK